MNQYLDQMMEFGKSSSKKLLVKKLEDTVAVKKVTQPSNSI